MELKHESRFLTPDEREALSKEKSGAPPSAGDITKLSGTLMQAMEDAGEHEPLNVMIRVKRSNWPGYAAEKAALVEAGLISDEEEKAFWETELAVKRQQFIKQAQAPAISAVESLGGKVTWIYDALYGIDAELTKSMITELAKSDSVVSLSVDSPAIPLANITGAEVIAGSQIKQFLDTQNNGEFGTDIHFAHVDLDPYHDEHPAFLEQGGSTASRIVGRFSCNANGCSSVLNFPVPANAHSTYTSGIVFGDLRDAQDPLFPGADTVAQVQRSGYAGEARGYLYQVPTESSARKAFDHIILRTPKPSLVSMPLGFASDLQCLGTSPIHGDANDLFENGILLISSAGNSGHTASASDCTVLSPAAAIGAFVVGGHGNSVTGTTTDVRSGAIWSVSSTQGTSRGGTNLEGGQRTIIDLTAFAYRSLVYDASGGYSLNAFGTSIAGPVVAAGAIDFIDFYKTSTSGDTKIDLPGILTANLLLMGDRQSVGGLSSNLFNNLWGAGRLRMRKFNNAGMDTPWFWDTNWTCISDGEVHTISLNGGNALNSSVNDFKAVIYWYDRRHETGLGLDDIDLTLKRTSGTVLVNSNSSFDEKERVYLDTAGGEALKLEIVGYSVGADDEGCGADSNRVYWALFYEDDARDDADGPSASVIFPE